MLISEKGISRGYFITTDIQRCTRNRIIKRSDFIICQTTLLLSSDGSGRTPTYMDPQLAKQD